MKLGQFFKEVKARVQNIQIRAAIRRVAGGIAAAVASAFRRVRRSRSTSPLAERGAVITGLLAEETGNGEPLAKNSWDMSMEASYGTSGLGVAAASNGKATVVPNPATVPGTVFAGVSGFGHGHYREFGKDEPEEQVLLPAQGPGATG